MLPLRRAGLSQPAYSVTRDIEESCGQCSTVAVKRLHGRVKTRQRKFVACNKKSSTMSLSRFELLNVGAR